GTGYSNLGHVHTLTFDTIKLDQGFSRQALNSPRCLSVCKAIIDLSRALDAEIVVEGIETEAQRDLFRDLGCEYGQGWLFGKPLDVDAMLASHGYIKESPPAVA
ncbi:MAG: EAL domain-containing protein, partial [Lysobacterales bacterium]